jgi:hypothetical protein
MLRLKLGPDFVTVCRLQCIRHTKGVPACTSFPHPQVRTVQWLIITLSTWQWVLEVVSHKRQASGTPCSRTPLQGSGSWLVQRAFCGNSLPRSTSVGVRPITCRLSTSCPVCLIHHIRETPRGARRESRNLTVDIRTPKNHSKTNVSTCEAVIIKMTVFLVVTLRSLVWCYQFCERNNRLKNGGSWSGVTAQRTLSLKCELFWGKAYTSNEII